MAGLPRLEVLDISGTGVTDMGLEALSKSPSLRRLNVFRCPKTTPEGIRRFGEARPGCKLVHRT